ncbi:uncharacterized protein BO87DRAFT_235358 [Aspergillus neoniger CBS 115656]|uniref:Uncharacterized protein n=1 Tax=Aspergillus neoniger (strain CBS 115656) TaxID=1448310 RepID=A0A318YPD1_ASPNB|nr:hypothetical protein BO87DRAFT_235358 [Aspergillus neoniger CBS 115656]PYH36229.1 hypothetical protein BO87DRAFT_235358 [Aspergillus neoniger CBS 115656]
MVVHLVLSTRQSSKSLDKTKKKRRSFLTNHQQAGSRHARIGSTIGIKQRRLGVSKKPTTNNTCPSTGRYISAHRDHPIRRSTTPVPMRAIPPPPPPPTLPSTTHRTNNRWKFPPMQSPPGSAGEQLI